MRVWTRLVRGPALKRKRQIIRYYADRYHLLTFVETGTYKGDMLEDMLGVFPELHSVEFDHALASKAVHRFWDAPRVCVYEGDSGTVLPRIISGRITNPALFWLDAHPANGTAQDTPIPVLAELKAILASPIKGHVVLIDDAISFERPDPGFPSIQEIADLMRGWTVTVDDNIIRCVRCPS